MRRKSGKWGNDKSKSGFGARRGPRVIWLGKDTSFGVAIYYLLTVSKKFKLSVVHAQDGTLRNEQRNLVGWQGFERGTGKCKTFCRSGSLGVILSCLQQDKRRKGTLYAIVHMYVLYHIPTSFRRLQRNLCLPSFQSLDNGTGKHLRGDMKFQTLIHAYVDKCASNTAILRYQR